MNLAEAKQRIKMEIVDIVIWKRRDMIFWGFNFYTSGKGCLRARTFSERVCSHLCEVVGLFPLVTGGWKSFALEKEKNIFNSYLFSLSFAPLAFLDFCLNLRKKIRKIPEKSGTFFWKLGRHKQLPIVKICTFLYKRVYWFCFEIFEGKFWFICFM